MLVCVDMCVKVRYTLDKTKIRISYNKINRDRTQNKIEQIRAKQKVMVWCDYLPDARLRFQGQYLQRLQNSLHLRIKGP